MAVPTSSATTRTGAVLLEVAATLAVVAAVVLGLLRTLFGAAGPLAGSVPDAVRALVERVAGPYALGEVPFVRATLAPQVEVRTTPTLFFYGADPVPAGRGEFSGPYEAQVNAYAPTHAQSAALLGATVLGALAVVVVALMLRRIARSLRDGDPFVAANAGRLRVAGLAVAVGGTGAALLRAWGEHLVLSDAAIRPLVVERFTVPWLPIVAGLAVLLLAEVFRQGAVLRADVEGLV